MRLQAPKSPVSCPTYLDKNFQVWIWKLESCILISPKVDGSYIPNSVAPFEILVKQTLPSLTYVEAIKRSANTDKLVNVVCKENASKLVEVPITDMGG